MYCYFSSFFFNLIEGKLGRPKNFIVLIGFIWSFSLSLDVYNKVAEIMSTPINSSSLTNKIILLYICVQVFSQTSSQTTFGRITR